MGWLNTFGLIFVFVIMIPNIIFAVKCKDGFENKFNNRFVEILEQAGRFGCFGFMIINIPKITFGWADRKAFAAYLIIDIVLVSTYCIIWAVCFKKNSLFRAISLSVIPSVMFLSSGLLIRSVPLTVSAIVFAPCHILISYKNSVNSK